MADKLADELADEPGFSIFQTSVGQITGLRGDIGLLEGIAAL